MKKTTNKIRKIPAPIICLFISLFFGSYCFAGGGGAGHNSNTCGGSSFSENACDANGLSWVWYSVDPENAPKVNGVVKFMFPTNGIKKQFSQGKATVVGCDGGFWMLAYDIFQENEKNRTAINTWYKSYQKGLGTSGQVQWRYTGKTRGQTGGRTWQYILDEGLTSVIGHPDNRATPLGFELGWNDKKFAEAKKDGNFETVKKQFEDVKDTLPIYDENGNYIGTGTNASINDIAWFCHDGDEKATFTGSTSTKVNGNNVANGATVVVHDASAKVQYTHTVKRENNGSSSSKQGKFYINSRDYTGQPSGWDYGSSNDWKMTNPLAKNGSESKTIPEGSFGLNPGGSIYTSSTLHYYKNLSGGNYTDENTSENGVTLKRPFAYFTGKINTRVWDGGSNGSSVKKLLDNDNKKANSTTIYDIVVSNDAGKYYIDFSKYAIRKDTDADGTAGGTVEVPWSATATDKTAQSNKKGLTNGATAEVGDKYTFTGTLRYGESKTVCVEFKVDQRVTSNGAQHVYKSCVKIRRANKQCAMDSNFTYGVTSGENIGRIGVVNNTKSGNEDYLWTSIEKDASVDVWAKPGDNIRFAYQACAGAFYTIEENKISNYGTHYTNEGRLTKKSGDNKLIHHYKNDKQNSGDGYLFGTSVTTSPYTNPSSVTRNGETLGIWSTGIRGNNKPSSGFLKDSNNTELNLRSPSTNNSRYGCNNASGTVSKKSFYQVSGKESGCILGQSDVGGVISQSFFYKHLKIYRANPLDTNELRHEASYDTYAPTANVKVPYNYILKPYVTNKNSSVGKIIYIGETSSMETGVATLPRSNATVSNKDYATITKDTHITVTNYYIHNGVKHYVGNAVQKTQRLNSNSVLNGTSETIENNTVTLQDDGIVAVGDKFCTEISVWPADSHDNPGITISGSDGENATTYKDIALREDSIKGTANTRTTASCSTIAKRPYMSVESSNAFSSQGYNLSRYTKRFTSASSAFYFGAWSEYGVFGKISTKTSAMASGASLAYSGSTAYASQSSNNNRANTDANVALKRISAVNNSNSCTFMTQTFANKDCEESNSLIGETSASQFREKMIGRYKGAGRRVPSFDTQKRYNSADYYGFKLGDLNDYAVNASGSSSADENSIIALKLDRNTILNANSIVTDANLDGQSNKTVVYDASNRDVIIDGNIQLNNSAVSSPRDIATVIIIARSVSFTSTPTRVDAVIIADQVNTCGFEGETAINLNNLSAGTCTLPLQFNAPVVTKKLILNRTFGAGTGASSIQRAEIFNLSTANYLWAYSQMTRYNQAVTTYSRELPSRY